MLLDYAQWPHFLYKYKINPGTNAPPPTAKVIKVNGLDCMSRIVGPTREYLLTVLLKLKMIITVCINMAFTQMGLRLAWPWYNTLGDHDIYKVPTVWTFFGHMLAAILGHDFFFYHGHM